MIFAVKSGAAISRYTTLQIEQDEKQRPANDSARPSLSFLIRMQFQISINVPNGFVSIKRREKNNGYHMLCTVIVQIKAIK